MAVKTKISPTFPSSLFKYGSLEHFGRTLSDRSLHFQNLSAYNDVHETEFTVVHHFRSEEERNESLSEITPFSQQNEIVSDYLNSLLATCFSSTPYSNLMWSHYGDNHSGVCYVFDEDPFEGKLFGGPVVYSNSTPEVEVFHNHTTAGMTRALSLNVVLTKSLEWAYEREFRWLYEKPEKVQLFRPDALKAVILGRRVGGKELQKVQEALASYREEHGHDVELLFTLREVGSFGLGITDDYDHRMMNESALKPRTRIVPDMDASSTEP